MSNDCTPIFLKLPPENIVVLKNFLETYDGMTGELRTLDSGRGEVVILAMSGTVDVVKGLLASIQDEISSREIAEPESVDGDWLYTPHKI